jgi:hypothetical protein
MLVSALYNSDMRRFASNASSLLLYSLVGLCLGASQARADRAEAVRCASPDTHDQRVQQCPKSGSILPETYPVMAVSVSDQSTDQYEGDYAWIESFADEVYRAQPESLPLIFVNASHENFLRLQNHFATLAGASPETRAQMRKNLRWVAATGVIDNDILGRQTVPVTLNWQQDLFRGFFDRSTGLPVVRINSDYPEIGNLANQTAEAMRACQIQVGPALQSTAQNVGTRGGNYDVVPGGICVVGQSDLSARDWASFAQDVCGGLTAVAAPTSWPRSQHLDEVFKVVPDLSANGSCGFALMFASPSRALQLLKAHPNDEAFDFASMSDSQFDDATLQSKQNNGANIVCGVYQNLVWNKLHPEWATAPSSMRSREPSGRPLLQPLSNRHRRYPSETNISCLHLKNSQLLAALDGDPVLKQYTQLTQTVMVNFEHELYQQVKAKHPGCSIKVIEAPALFVGQLTAPERLHASGLANGNESSGFAIFPNLTNGDVIGRTVLLPDSHNPLFNRDIAQSFKPLAVTLRWVDTFNEHLAQGNLHCSTQILRYCRP